jgi:L-ascorbate metabolism protein UlaG (beta-lactamase superfamily)
MVWRMLLAALTLFIAANASAQDRLPTDTIKTAKGELRISFLGYGSLRFEFQGKNIYVDPIGRWADYTRLPKADLILITHNATDHLDTRAIYTLKGPNTSIVLCDACATAERDGIVMRNGDVQTVKGFRIEAVPAYNIDYQRNLGGTWGTVYPRGTLYHEKGKGNGYVITIDDKRFYVASDTEFIPEMKGLKNIDAAFLPLALPHTLTPEKAAEAAKAFKPRIVYPYQYSREDPQELVRLLKNVKGIEVRVRSMAGITGESAKPGYNREGITKPEPTY